MDVEMYEKMDEIMETMHQITTYLIEYEKREENGEKITKKQVINDKILNMLFSRVQNLYREIQKIISEELEFTQNFIKETDSEIDDKIGTIDMPKEKLPDSLAIATINDLDGYLEMAYTGLRYISLNDREGKEFVSSIYKDTGTEEIRNAEYNLQQNNLENLSVRNNVQNKIGRLSYREKDYVLSYMVQNKFYLDYAFKQINRYIGDIGKKEQEMSEEEINNIKNGLIKQKYILYYAYLNNEYNGILQVNDQGKLAFAKRCIDEGSESMLLNMTQFEIDENIKYRLLEYKDEFRELIKSVITKERKNKKILNTHKEDQKTKVNALNGENDEKER